MSDPSKCDATAVELLAIMQADLTASGARTGDEIAAALTASAENLAPPNPFASLTPEGPFQWSKPKIAGLPRIKLMFAQPAGKK